MSALGRAFVAVVPPDHVLDALEARVAPVRAAHEGLRWSRREQWHLTLRFLGAVPDADRLVTALGDALTTVSTMPRLQLGGAGAFPNARRASVLWLGVQDGAGALGEVVSAVESASVASGFAPEPRPFAAHLTVARVPRPRDVTAVLDALGVAAVGAAWPVADVVLVASDTRSSGAVYSEVGRVPLATMGE